MANGGVVVAGITVALYDEEYDSSDFIAVKLDAVGTVVWRWQVKRSCVRRSKI